MQTTTRTRTVSVILGSVSGALINGVLWAFDWWIFTYTDQRTGFLGSYQSWAPLAAIFGAMFGAFAGAILGVFLSFVRRGPLFGALAGAVEGLAIILLLVGSNGITTGDTHDDLMFAALVPVGAISGSLTSLVVAAITSSAKRREHSPTVLGLQQDKADESPS